MTFLDIQHKSFCFIVLMCLASALTWMSVHVESKGEKPVNDKLVGDVDVMRNAEEKGEADCSSLLPGRLQFVDTIGIDRSINIFAPITGMFIKDELNPSFHYQTSGGGGQGARPEQTTATGKRQTPPEEESGEKEKLTQQTYEVAYKSAPAEKTEEWDWQVCPSVFGCPCPMMP